MEATGMARRIDDLGRIVLPAETRRLLGISRGDELSISVDGRKIILEKLEVSCTFCGAEQDLKDHRGKKVCSTCASAISSS
jgi:AbrB family transcriptional regulator, transcriptional pleiotropic regulator of transition state genes